MKIIDNINNLLGDDLKTTLKNGTRLKIAASCFSIYAFEALKSELSKIDKLKFVFTAPTFVPEGATDQVKREQREFFIPKAQRERSLYGTEFEIQLRNKLTQRAVARECADWIRKKATFRSNKTKAPMQQFICVEGKSEQIAYMPIGGFTAVDLGLQKGNAISNIVNRFDGAPYTNTYLDLFNQIWGDPDKLEDVTETICQHIESIYQENSPERIYFLILYNLFNEFLEEIDEDVLPNDRTGYLDSLIWNRLFNFQRDAATGIINKLETYNGCILADSVGLGKTFTALAVIKYYELRNRSVLVLCPKKLADNWMNYNSNLKTNLHDLGEAINGDIAAVDQVEGINKGHEERKDLESLIEPLSESLRKEILGLWDEYENASSREALLAKAFDKIETILQHTQGKNHEDFDYNFNLSYGVKYTDFDSLTMKLRALIDKDTRRLVKGTPQDGIVMLLLLI